VAGKKEYPPLKVKTSLLANGNTTREQKTCIYLDKTSGRLYSYVFFDGTVFREYDGKSIVAQKNDYKTIDLETLMPTLLQIRNSIMGLVQDRFLSADYEFETEEQMKKFGWAEFNWEDDNFKIPYSAKTLDRKHTLENEGYIFGSSCFIWEIKGWKELGQRIKKYKKAFYIFPSAVADIILGRKKFKAEDCIRVDNKLFNQMEAIHKKQN